MHKATKNTIRINQSHHKTYARSNTHGRQSQDSVAKPAIGFAVGKTCSGTLCAEVMHRIYAVLHRAKRAER